MSKERDCNHCGKTYTYKLNSSKFCSGSCRASAAVKKKGLGAITTTKPEVKTPERNRFDVPNDIGPQAQYIITQSNKEADRWERLYNEVRTELKEKEKAEKQLRDELAQIKTDQKIAEASAPGGLSGLMESPAMAQILQHAGPGIGKLAERFADWVANSPSTPQISGTGGNGDGLTQFAQWLASLDEDTRLQVWQILQYLSSLPPHELQNMLIHFESMGILKPLMKTG